MQGYKANKESVENERNKERQDEGHKYGTSVTENKGTAEPGQGDEQRTGNENGAARIRVKVEDEQSKGNMKYQEDKLNAEGQNQMYEDNTKRNDPGNEEKHNVKIESERSVETKNGNGSKESKGNHEEQGAFEEINRVTDKRKRQDAESYHAEDETKSDEAGNKKDRVRKQGRNSNIKRRNRLLIYILEMNVLCNIQVILAVFP